MYRSARRIRQCGLGLIRFEFGVDRGQQPFGASMRLKAWPGTLCWFQSDLSVARDDTHCDRGVPSRET
jgi:hypothetical protein